MMYHQTAEKAAAANSFSVELAGVLQYIEWKQHYALCDRVSRKELEVLYTHDNC